MFQEIVDSEQHEAKVKIKVSNIVLDKTIAKAMTCGLMQQLDIT